MYPSRALLDCGLVDKGNWFLLGVSLHVGTFHQSSGFLLQVRDNYFLWIAVLVSTNSRRSRQ